MAGTLFVVATPIGNLEDLTFRALRMLGEVDLIAAEDTRRTSKLLARYSVRKPMVSLREHNEARESQRLVRRLESGGSIALVSDAGTPGIADPGARLVNLARTHGVHVVPIPGATAIAAALSVSGLPADTFVFLGFPPSSGKKRQEWLDELRDEHRTVIFFEAPHRVARTIGDVTKILGNKEMVVCRELTKSHEEVVIWPNDDTVSGTEPKGEFAIVVGPSDRVVQAKDHVSNVIECERLFGLLTKECHLDRDIAVKMVAGGLDIPASTVRKVVKRASILAKQQNTPGSDPTVS